MNILLNTKEAALLTTCLSAVIDWRSGAIAASQLQQILTSFDLEELQIIYNYILDKSAGTLEENTSIKRITQDMIDYHDRVNEVSKKQLLPETFEIPKSLTAKNLSKFILDLSLAIDALIAAYYDEVGKQGTLAQSYDEHDLVVKYKIVDNDGVSSLNLDLETKARKVTYWKSLTDIPPSQAEIVVGIARFYIQRQL